jgi:hypothetical protein
MKTGGILDTSNFRNIYDNFFGANVIHHCKICEQADYMKENNTSQKTHKTKPVIKPKIKKSEANKFRVGDIIICHTGRGTRSDGRKGFVEEILHDNDSESNIVASYSIYGFDPVKFDPKRNYNDVADYHYGEISETHLEKTGESMTVRQLMEYQNVLFDPAINGGWGWGKDINIVIRNLGRKGGTNEKDLVIP